MASSRANNKNKDKLLSSSPKSSSTDEEIKFSDYVKRLEELPILDKRLHELITEPDIHVLFRIYDRKYFGGMLTHHQVDVNWSDRLTATAGYCHDDTDVRPITICLSRKLLKGESKLEMVDTLLHEMVHAWTIIRGMYGFPADTHGPIFRGKCQELYEQTGLRIQVCHNFGKYDEKRYAKVLKKERQEMRNLWLKKTEKEVEELGNSFQNISIKDNDKDKDADRKASPTKEE